MKLLTFSRVRFAIFIVVLHKLRLLRAACAMLACTLIMLVVRQRATLYVPTPMGASRSNARNPANQRTPAEYDLPFEELSVQPPTVSNCTDGSFIRQARTGKHRDRLSWSISTLTRAISARDCRSLPRYMPVVESTCSPLTTAGEIFTTRIAEPAR